MIQFWACKSVFQFFFKSGLRSRRTRLLILVSLIPAVVTGIVLLLNAVSPKLDVSRSFVFSQLASPFFFQLLVPLISLFYGCGCISDEIDNQTLVYLTTTKTAKSSLLAGKASAFLFLAMAIFALSFILTFFLAFTTRSFEREFVSLGLAYLGSGFLCVTAYFSFFVFFGALLKKPVLAGFVFIFGWEYIVQYIPGSTQKLTISHYVKSLLPYRAAPKNSLLVFQLQPSSTMESVFILLLVSAVFMGLAALLLIKKEFARSVGQ